MNNNIFNPKNRFSVLLEPNVKKITPILNKEKPVEKNRQKKFNLETEFPELIKTNTSSSQTFNKSYINKLKEEISSVISDDKDNLGLGWVSLKRDKLDNKIIIKMQPKTIDIPSYKDDDYFVAMLNKLNNIHEKRTNHFIELNGYDVWEQLYRFPDWREREAYLNKIEQEQEEEDEEEIDDDEYSYYFVSDYEDGELV